MPELTPFSPLYLDVPSTQRGHERCLALLLSANSLFLAHGYDAVSLNDIVQHAGGSKASIYKYFGNKEGLFAAICDYRCQQFIQDICVTFQPEQDELRQYLITTLVNFHQHLLEPENAAFLRLILERTQKNAQLAAHIHQHGPQMIQATIAKALEYADQQGILVCTHPSYSAQFFFGILRNLEWTILMGLTVEKNEQEFNSYIIHCVDLFLAGHQKR